MNSSIIDLNAFKQAQVLASIAEKMNGQSLDKLKLAERIADRDVQEAKRIRNCQKTIRE